ncbi:MAG TPA: hypothetical protein VG871_11670 [Vicinamibacterales bacterium]|nr:hypothetical protein [Vicinamibacterales bacterium]
MTANADSHARLLNELNEERAAALARISRTLESLIDLARDSRRRLDTLEGAARDAETAHYRDLRERAKTYRWYLEVQREAIGLRQHQLIDQFYEIPGPL